MTLEAGSGSSAIHAPLALAAASRRRSTYSAFSAILVAFAQPEELRARQLLRQLRLQPLPQGLPRVVIAGRGGRDPALEIVVGRRGRRGRGVHGGAASGGVHIITRRTPRAIRHATAVDFSPLADLGEVIRARA
ncbi:MAG: hypothetical protein K8W52_16340 [Deltaproteobacteria bacterium]|nr:hypothetical protein [Deltaproteobacteria bacterium]